MAGAKFELKYDDVIRIQSAIQSYGSGAEKTLNNYLHGEAAKMMIDSVTNLIPLSKEGKKHARMNQWFQKENYNLAVTIRASGSFWYLFFPLTGQGTSRDYGERDFFTQGIDLVYDKVVQEMLTILSKKFEEVI